MSRLMCIIIRNFRALKFSRLEIDPRKTRQFSASKIWRYTVKVDLSPFHLVEVAVSCFSGLCVVDAVVGGRGRGDEGRGVGVVFPRPIRCLSWAEREWGSGTGLLPGLWGEAIGDSCMCMCACL